MLIISIYTLIPVDVEERLVTSISQAGPQYILEKPTIHCITPSVMV